jgi:bacterioferritin
MDKQKSIEALQFFATGLTEGALVHKLQGQIFKAQGFGKLGQKYRPLQRGDGMGREIR